MVGSNRFIRIIIMTLGVYVIVANIILWANEPSVNMALLEENGGAFGPSGLLGFSTYHGTGVVNFKGFSWFFDKISTFPGPLYTHGMLMTYGNILSGFNVTNIGILDVLLAIFRVITIPVMCIVTILTDVINNCIWFFSFIFLS